MEPFTSVPYILWVIRHLFYLLPSGDHLHTGVPLLEFENHTSNTGPFAASNGVVSLGFVVPFCSPDSGPPSSRQSPNAWSIFMVRFLCSKMTL